MQHLHLRVLVYPAALLLTAWTLHRMLSPLLAVPLLGGLAAAVDTSWHPPARWSVDSLRSAINGTGTYGFIFNTSTTADGEYGVYNWCNMPHVRRREYKRAPAGYALKYVELIHRHHKRTPYAANCFPQDAAWNCSDSGLFYYGEPLNPRGNGSAAAYWSVFQDAQNVFAAAQPGCTGDCQFPQISRGGLDDAWQHGADLYGVYHGELGLIPDSASAVPAGVTFRVTNNVITSQVAGMVLSGMFAAPPTAPVPLLVQPPAVDSLEPTYPCPAAAALQAQYGVGSADPTWTAHLNASSPLFAALDALSGVDPAASDWHVSWDHYFDNLSARLCHARPLPCNATSGACVSAAQADEVFRLGEWEYSWLWRGAPQSLLASAGIMGGFVAELAAHLRAAAAGDGAVGRYWHNVAHDGSVAPLLGVLQADKMVWPGMGAEVVFELWEKDSKWFVRVLWGGEVLKSSSPSLGTLDMMPLDKLLAYFDALVGKDGSKLKQLCGIS